MKALIIGDIKKLMDHERAEDISAVKEVKDREQRVSSPLHARRGGVS